jgi:hypothetical protein
MKYSFFILVILTFIFVSKSNSQGPKIQSANSELISQISKTYQFNNDELIGNYARSKNGPIIISILRIGENYYLKYPDSHRKVLMTEISESNCLRLLGKNWKAIFISGLQTGAFFVFKVKVGCSVKGKIIDSGYYSALPAAGIIWKVK